MKRLNLFYLTVISIALMTGCAESNYQASPMQCYHDNMIILNDVGNLKSALKAGCVRSAKSSLLNIELKYDELKWEKCKSILIKNKKDIDELKQSIEKKSSQKNLVCKRFEYNIYRPSQRDLKLYL